MPSRVESSRAASEGSVDNPTMEQALFGNVYPTSVKAKLETPRLNTPRARRLHKRIIYIFARAISRRIHGCVLTIIKAVLKTSEPRPPGARLRAVNNQACLQTSNYIFASAKDRAIHTRD